MNNAIKHVNRSFRLQRLGLGLLLLFGSIALNAQDAITGTVSDALGAPIPGVSVVEQGTTNGTSTDFDGNFTISAPANAILEFRYLGFLAQSITVNGRSTINVQMEEDTEQLDEVVVIGYGAVRKEAVTGSVASIQGESLREVASSNVSQALWNTFLKC